MARNLTASDRKRLIKMASTMPVGSPERKAILKGLLKTKVASPRMARRQSADEMAPSEIEDILVENVEDAIDDAESDFDGYTSKVTTAGGRGYRFGSGTDAAAGGDTYTTLSSLSGSGIRPSNSKAAKVVEDAIERTYEYAQKEWAEDNADFVAENDLSEDQINYNDLSDLGFDSEAEELSDYENETQANNDITIRLGAFYFGPDNSRVGRKGEHNIEVFSLIEFDGHLFKDGRIDTYRSDFSFTSERELKSKLKKALDAAVKAL